LRSPKLPTRLGTGKNFRGREQVCERTCLVSRIAPVSYFRGARGRYRVANRPPFLIINRRLFERSADGQSSPLPRSRAGTPMNSARDRPWRSGPSSSIVLASHQRGNARPLPRPQSRWRKKLPEPSDLRVGKLLGQEGDEALERPGLLLIRDRLVHRPRSKNRIS
jgi:hypothetical protein